MTFHSKTVGSLPKAPAPQKASGDPRAEKKRVAHLAPLIAVLSLLGLCIGPFAAFAIESPYSATDARAAEQATAEEFAAFPAPARRAALVVAGYPESLLEIQRLQQYSADRFAALVESYPRETQAQIWDLVRYPGLASDLARGGKKSSNELDDLADRYPEADHFAIIEEGKKRHDLWVQIYALDLESQQSLSEILAPEPREVQAAFDEVAARPDLMSLLAENIQWTTLQGAAYRENPAQVDARFATIAAQVVARRQAAETEWADEVTDPEVAEELEVAAREFADEYGYDYEDELGASATRQTPHNHSTTTIIVEQRVNPYPYWFGYPSWYDYAFWYPLSFSSHIGFGYRYGNGFGYGQRYASFGLPSPFFLGWYHDVYRPRYARNHRGNRAHRRSIRYYDNHRPHRSASHRRHRRGGDHVGSLSDRARVERRQNRREDRRDRRFEVKRDRRGHADALADRAQRKQRRDVRTDRQDRRVRGERGQRAERGERRNERNLRSQAREQARFTRTDRGLNESDVRDARRDRRANGEKRQKREKRDIRADKRERNPAIRPGSRPAERIAERKNDGVRNSPKLQEARADVPRLARRERNAERRVERKSRNTDKRVDRTARRAERSVVRSQNKAERQVRRAERTSSKRIARAERKPSRGEARASSGGGQRRMKSAKQSSRPQRAAKSNRGSSSRQSKRQAQRQGGGKRGKGNGRGN